MIVPDNQSATTAAAAMADEVKVLLPAAAAAAAEVDGEQVLLPAAAAAAAAQHF